MMNFSMKCARSYNKIGILRESYCHRDHTVRAASNGGTPVRDGREDGFFSKVSVDSPGAVRLKPYQGRCVAKKPYIYKRRAMPVVVFEANRRR